MPKRPLLYLLPTLQLKFCRLTVLQNHPQDCNTFPTTPSLSLSHLTHSNPSSPLFQTHFYRTPFYSFQTPSPAEHIPSLQHHTSYHPNPALQPLHPTHPPLPCPLPPHPTYFTTIPFRASLLLEDKQPSSWVWQAHSSLDMASSSSDILDAHCFGSQYHQDLFEEHLAKKSVTPETCDGCPAAALATGLEFLNFQNRVSIVVEESKPKVRLIAGFVNK
ncbi:hypothetical protein PIB30_085753 [Stylosanthes scabra]|uniref:Uncharacterized protein n=1 Tax=Stylosanthes scabra TaxID=79078 RepID=A0ABU6XQX4_9FABA|nr:hypothetical protein [Stylosanthes scabra]